MIEVNQIPQSSWFQKKDYRETNKLCHYVDKSNIADCETWRRDCKKTQEDGTAFGRDAKQRREDIYVLEIRNYIYVHVRRYKISLVHSMMHKIEKQWKGLHSSEADRITWPQTRKDKRKEDLRQICC